MMPCLNKNSLKLLVGTADERYDQSPEYFRKTHFPQVMHRFNDSQLIAEVTEGELLEELKEVDSDGNRVYLVFGSTGSGKSELLRWLKDKWLVEVSERPVIRISRTELNPQTLIKKCLDALDLSLDVCIDEDKWGLLLKKPITLINQMVWTALAESLESDEEIVPAALLLRPIIENNIVEFTSQIKRGKIKKPLEVLHREQFESLLANTTLNISLEYAPFRQTLSRKLDHFLFEGRDIGTLFKQLSQQIKSKGIRPLLLIDDLVQSVNIYATNILDQLITLEEGNWDVVIGLTPGAVQDTEKGFSLTQRIKNLDTINDRVKKLWLSDESGKDFFNLDRKQVIPYMANYLTQLKATQGFKCSPECPYYNQCSSNTLESSNNDSKLSDIEVQLLPFNSHMLRRTYDAIPMGKGKLRYMILNSKEVIRFFLRGKKDISRILPLIRREMFAEHTDVLIKTLAEWYASEEAGKITISEPILKHFGYKDSQIVVKLNSIENSLREEQQFLEEPTRDSNTGFNEKEVVRDWVEGREVNEELLLPVRSGVAALVHDAIKGVHMSRSFTSRTSSTIQRNEVVNRTRYPITLQDNNDESTISVSRGYIAIQIANFQTMKYSEKVKTFQKISNEYEIAKWIHQAESIHEEWLNSLEQALGLKLPVFVYGMKNWVQNARVYSESLWASNVIQYSPFRTELTALLEDCYSDWYLLRDNFFQPPSNAMLTNEEFDRWFRNLTPSNTLENYQIGNTTLRVFLSQLKESYHRYSDLLHESFKQSFQKRTSMIPFLIGSGNLKLIELAGRIKAFSEKKIVTQQDFVTYTLLEQELENQELAAQYKRATTLNDEIKQLTKQFDEMALEVADFLTECNMQTNYERDEAEITEKDEVVWSELEANKASLTTIVQELSSLNNCLALTPRNLVKHLLSLQIKLEVLDHIKNLQFRLANCANRLKKKKLIGSELVTLISEWQSIDFYQLRDWAERKLQHEQTKLHLLQVIRNDLDCEDIGNIYHLLEKINESPQIRPSIKRHVRLLVENGYSTLPPVQWKRLLDEIKEKFPNLFDVVEIRLVVGDNK
ncbi:hypothetical protein [Paenibacillus tyrfis]|uniref:Uncharacterized protein n=1 Tax=Paenibacillus tyrfis TaxID=1501230 RepID=A0A081NU70_9BACL|nr:hypothetical protein [Paenibacillus tyrfis]KEQ21993.1 hypothetical protein ET33_28405 [Paenibacillus tyrfis]